MKVGILLEGSRPIGEGINGALRGFALVDEEEIQVIAKYLPERELLCEIICAQIGRELELPIPEPILLFDNQKKPVFGSTDIGYPNLNHYFAKNIEMQTIMSRLSKWVYLQSASFFDELIFNADRHPGNLLYDGVNFHLIDHGLTLHESYPPETLPDRWKNQLFTFAVSLCKNDLDRVNISNNGSAWTDNLINKNIVSKKINEIHGNKIVIDSLYNFLSIRQNLLKSMINIRVGAAQTDFINA
ncbi:HipA family kinase [Salmonella enterica]